MGTNSKMSSHLDKSVIYLFLITFLISASVLAYRIKEYTPCEEVTFVVKSKDFVTGKLIKFIDKTSDVTSRQWDFGDGSKPLGSKIALHIFKKPGEYDVTLNINGTCQEVKRIVIKEKAFVVDSKKLPKFKLPSSIKIGQKLVVVDKTPNATSWEWRFGETAGVNSNKKVARYVYETPGLKTVSLVVNGDINYVTSKKIEVLPLKKRKKRKTRIKSLKRTVGKEIKDSPTSSALGESKGNEDDGPTTVPYIGESQFKNKLMLVSKRKKTAKAFSEYLCGDLNKKIIVNGKTTTFLAFCELIKDKKLKIKEVVLYREKGSNCIKNITITRSKFIF